MVKSTQYKSNVDSVQREVLPTGQMNHLSRYSTSKKLCQILVVHSCSGLQDVRVPGTYSSIHTAKRTSTRYVLQHTHCEATDDNKVRNSAQNATQTIQCPNQFCYVNLVGKYIHAQPGAKISERGDTQPPHMVVHNKVRTISYLTPR